MKYIQVTKQEFYDRINQLDAIVESHSDWTYFKLRSGAIVGRCDGYKMTGDEKVYYLTGLEIELNPM